MPEFAYRIDHSIWGEITRAWEAANGWLRCDGRLLDNTGPDNVALFKAIGFAWGGDGDTMFNLPDLQGFFLRGVDSSREPHFLLDPDRNERFESNTGGNKGIKVGSVQSFATAAPKDSGFKTDRVDDHTHWLNFEIDAARDVNGQNNTVAYPARSIASPSTGTGKAGAHEHEVTGGDKETRPVNAYVYWIIRYK